MLWQNEKTRRNPHKLIMQIMKFSHIAKFVVFLSILVFFSSGCAPEKAEIHESEKSVEGVVLENFLPEDTIITYSFNTQNNSQRENLDELLQHFPENNLESLFELANESTPTGIEFEELKSVFSDKFRVLVGMRGPAEKNDPEIYIATTIADTKKALELVDKLAATDKFEKGELDGYITLSSDKLYLVLYKDTVLIVEENELLHQAVTRIENNEKSLLSNEQFIDAYNKLPKPNIGNIFMDFKQISKLFGIEKTDNDNSGKSKENEPSFDLFQSITAESFALIAEKNGVKMLVDVVFNPESEKFNITDFPYKKPYMYKKIPGKNLIMYAEAYELGRMYELGNIFMDDPDRFKPIEKALMKNLDLDLEEDILSWMDKGYAFVMQRNQGIIPGISIYVDANSNIEGAKKLINIIDMAMEQFAVGMEMSAPEDIPIEQVVVKEIVDLSDSGAGSDLYRFKIDFTVLSDEQMIESGLPIGVFTEPIEIYYGITEDNYFTISTYTGLSEGFEKTLSVAENEMIKEGQQSLNDYPLQLTYVSIDEMLKYVDTFVEVLKTAQEDMPEEFFENYDEVKQYLSPIKYFIAGNKKPSENTVEGLMFVKIDSREEK